MARRPIFEKKRLYRAYVATYKRYENKLGSKHAQLKAAEIHGVHYQTIANARKFIKSLNSK